MSRSILVVEDNDDCRHILTLFISRLGYEVVEARDGVEALEKVAQESPVLILMDLRLPRLGGVEATSRLKTDPQTRNIPVVVCTAFGAEAYKNTALVEQAAEIVQKPIKLEVLQALLKRHLPDVRPAPDSVSRPAAAARNSGRRE